MSNFAENKIEMPAIISKMIAGAIAAVLIWVIYFCITGFVSYLKRRKNVITTLQNNEEENVDNKRIITDNSKCADKKYIKKKYFTVRNIRAILFILIGCLSFYYSTQCVFYDQFNGFNSIYFGDDHVIANELSNQIHCVGFQARGDGKTLIELMQGLFIIVGLICITYGTTHIRIKEK